MDRLIEKELVKWKQSSDRLPLIIRGARQVGKSFTVEKFGKENFESVLVINFELAPEFGSCFESLDPSKIIAKIELMTEQSVTDGETLLFLDEIQQCPKALLALRYFKEKRSALHVISAGSLLEFALHEENFSFPVGRVQFLFMRPLSFHEFLDNAGYKKLLIHLQNVSLTSPIDHELHEHTLKILREYMLLGGMPAVVAKYIKTHSYLEARLVQTALLESYRNDFGKYASKAQFKYLQRFFERAPLLVGQHFKFVKIDPEARSRELKIALEQLCWTGLIHRVFMTSANGIPLQAEMNEKKFKLVFLDIGLMQNANKINPSAILNDDVWQINEGALGEQLVGQELIANGSFYQNEGLFFWEKEKLNASAEVDYVTEFDSKVAPIEVKAGKDGRLRSLKLFLLEKQLTCGVVISKAPLEQKDNVLNVPFYLIDQLPRLLKEF
jgi:uncharacterized protein